MTPQEVKSYLDSFINHEHHLERLKRHPFKLERMKRLLEVLGRPDDHLRIIHVAGSKAKGSTAAIIASILREAGYRVGLYTSPHLNHPRERIRILDRGRPTHLDLLEIFTDAIPEEDLVSLVGELKPQIESV